MELGIQLKTGILLAVLAVLFNLGCNETPSAPTPMNPKELMGVWSWVGTRSYFLPGWETPDSVGYSRQLIITHDSIFTDRRTDTWVRYRSPFCIVWQEWWWGGDSAWVLQFENGARIDTRYTFVAPDSMFLQEYASDAPLEKFIKVR